MSDSSLSRVILEYIQICRSEQRTIDYLIRSTNIQAERTYNLLYRYLNIISDQNSLFSTPIFHRVSLSRSPGTESSPISAHPAPSPPTTTPPPPTTTPPRRSSRTPLRPLRGPPTRLRRLASPLLTETNIRLMTSRCIFSDLSSNETICPITREAFTPNDTILKIIFCGHIFKATSLREWFRRSTQCPVCRHDIRINFFPRLNENQ